MYWFFFECSCFPFAHYSFDFKFKWYRLIIVVIGTNWSELNADCSVMNISVFGVKITCIRNESSAIFSYDASHANEIMLALDAK